MDSNPVGRGAEQTAEPCASEAGKAAAPSPSAPTRRLNSARNHMRSGCAVPKEARSERAAQKRTRSGYRVAACISDDLHRCAICRANALWRGPYRPCGREKIERLPGSKTVSRNAPVSTVFSRNTPVSTVFSRSAPISLAYLRHAARQPRRVPPPCLSRSRYFPSAS